MVWEGRDACKTGRSLLGATNPLASAPGTIRGDFAIDVGRNVCHGSDSVESAKKEIALWFDKSEIQKWNPAQFDWFVSSDDRLSAPQIVANERIGSTRSRK